MSEGPPPAGLSSLLSAKFCESWGKNFVRPF
jgi:hypothetical protein